MAEIRFKISNNYKQQLIKAGTKCVSIAKQLKKSGDGYNYNISSLEYKKAAAELDLLLGKIRRDYPSYIRGPKATEPKRSKKNA